MKTKLATPAGYCMAIILAASNAQAALITVTECTSIAGQSYDVKMSDKSAAFGEDGISGGIIVLNFDTVSKEFDILVRDRIGFTSIKKDGGKLFKVMPSLDTLSFVFVDTGASSIYSFSLDDDYKGKMIWSQHKEAGGFSRGWLFSASCKRS